MKPEQTPQEPEVAVEARRSVWNTVTPFSKYLAMALFIILPFLGGYVGYVYAPEKVVEVEKEVIREVEVEKVVEVPVEVDAKESSTVQCVVDSDCVLVQPDCEDCKFAAIGEAELEEFREEKRNRCELNPPEIMCDIVFNGDIKCIDNSCQIVE